MTENARTRARQANHGTQRLFFGRVSGDPPRSFGGLANQTGQFRPGESSEALRRPLPARTMPPPPPKHRSSIRGPNNAGHFGRWLALRARKWRLPRRLGLSLPGLVSCHDVAWLHWLCSRKVLMAPTKGHVKTPFPQCLTSLISLLHPFPSLYPLYPTCLPISTLCCPS